MLDYVLEQTYPEIEMILFDDGSTDRTVQVAKSYQKRFAERGYEYRIIRAEHKCAADAINKGLPFVTGEYLIWPDGDDRLEPDSVEKRVRFLKKYPQYQCVRSLPYYFKQITGELTRADENVENYSSEELFWDILEYRTYVCCGCYMLKAEPFFEIYPERHIPEYHVGQNFQMLLPFLFRYKCPTIPEKLYGVCVREGSHSRTKLTRKEEEQRYQEYEELIDEIADICHIDDKASKERLTYWKARRRYVLAVKYKSGKQIISSCCQLLQLHRFGELSIYKMLKDFIWACLENTWVVKDVYPIYRNTVVLCRRTVKQLAVGRTICSVRCKKKRIGLTFDGSYQYTTKVLEKLEQYHVKATFFLSGDWIEHNMVLCGKISEAGHEVGNHSYSHVDMTALSEVEACEEIKRVQQLIWKATGKKCTLFRFPYGKCNVSLVELVKKGG